MVKNFHSQSLHNEIAPLVLTLSTDWKHDHIFAKIRPESPQQTLQYLEATWNTFSPDYPFDYRFVEDVFRQQYSDDRQMGTIPGYFTLLSIFISSLGLLGLTSFLAEQRTKEIGIRKVLGASVPEIVALVSKEFLLLLMVAITIAWPIAYFTLQSMLSTYAYRTDVSLWVFVTGGALACIIALLTVSFQSLKAARANPIVSLKYE